MSGSPTIPDDFYEQTPDANHLATEAIMNAVETAETMLGLIGRMLRPLAN